MISLYDYRGHRDEDGTGLKLNEYAQLRNQPYEKRYLQFNDTEVFLYTKEFLDEYFKIEKIFNK